MTIPRMTVLVVGATGSIGRLVVEEALRQGHAVRALVRTPGKARRLPLEAQVVRGDVTRPDTLTAAVDGIDAVVFTLGSDGAGKVGAESVDYGGVRNVLDALGSRTARIALMTSIGVTNRTGTYNRTTESHDWKRRSERLVRASGLPYTIVRPGWSSSRAIHARPAIPAMASLRDARSPRSWSAASAWITHCARPSDSSRPPGRHRTTSTHCSPLSLRTPKAPWTASTTWRTCRWKTSRGRCVKIWMRCLRTGLPPHPDTSCLKGAGSWKRDSPQSRHPHGHITLVPYRKCPARKSR